MKSKWPKVAEMLDL